MRTALLIALLVLLLGIAGRMEHEDSIGYQREWREWHQLHGIEPDGGDW